MRLKIRKFVVLSFLFPVCVNGFAWTIFGYDNADQCIKENIEKVRFPDAGRLLGAACVLGYGPPKGVEKAWISAGRCIADEAKKMYSMEKSIEIVNSCSKDSVTFRLYFNYLNQAEARRREELIEATKKRNSVPSGPVTIFDIESGQMKICHQIGNAINCF
jgi:hypothetical protein